MQSAIAIADEVSFRYIQHDEEGRVMSEKTALSGVSFDVHAGEFLAILGHNGSGKSTLVKHLNALLRPTEGTVTVDGMDTRDESRLLEIRRLAGMVFQNPDNQIIGQIVEEDVAFGPENIGIPTEEIRVRVDGALDRVEMRDRSQSSPNKLSGGQKQRVSIAGVLAMKPEVLLLDEPTAMLDPQGRREVLQAIHTVNRREGITVILITHDMEEAVGADRVVVMDKGQIALTGTPREVFAQEEKLRALGLELPFAARMANKLRAHGVQVEGTPLTREELTDCLRDSIK